MASEYVRRADPADAAIDVFDGIDLYRWSATDLRDPRSEQPELLITGAGPLDQRLLGRRERPHARGLCSSRKAPDGHDRATRADSADEVSMPRDEDPRARDLQRDPRGWEVHAAERDRRQWLRQARLRGPRIAAPSGEQGGRNQQSWATEA